MINSLSRRYFGLDVNNWILSRSSIIHVNDKQIKTVLVLQLENESISLLQKKLEISISNR